MYTYEQVMKLALDYDVLNAHFIVALTQFSGLTTRDQVLKQLSWREFREAQFIAIGKDDNWMIVRSDDIHLV